ncbi:hypothetical protein COY17_01870 [Candidatus Saccharibacteria bacterium CG_4_10_14_0_2_um_filter_52_9]|nr:MAG: hypothetical protein COY17_01870 [Candidatus Saccharibacteria bacterium CG_4_10_14_0_2_um_filter_52_9]
MATNDKDTIYIDIDDEITGIIDKLGTSKGKVVALVLPKRASVFQSIVNMKLLKRAADNADKHLVLITSEAGLMPLAGAAGVHVAKTLTSRPEIPSGPQLPDDKEEIVEEDVADEEAPLDPNKTLGQLAGGGAAATVGADGVETLILDDEDLPPEADAAKAAGEKTFEPPGKKKNKNKKLAVPNFERFRLLLIGGGLLLILLIFGLIFATVALPKATISIKTDATSVDTSVGLNLATAATKLDEATNTVPAKLATVPKTYTQQVPTTGQKNNGNKASGSVKIINCGASSVTIPAGNGFSSSSSQTYISTESVTVPKSTYDNSGNGFVCNDDGNATVNVIAQSGGSSYNAPAGGTYKISNGPASTTAKGGTMSGGTDSIVQIVNQNDITAAKAKITVNDADIKTALDALLKKDGYFSVTATYVAGTPAVTTSANVGDVANNVTVTQTVSYTMFGVHKDDLRKLASNDIKKQIDTNKQSILSDGVDNANYNVDNISATTTQVTMSGKATAGPDLDIATIKQNAAGKKPGPVKSELSDNPDVKSVDIKLSPFWVSSIPKKTSRITVNIAKPDVTVKTNSSTGGSH